MNFRISSLLLLISEICCLLISNLSAKFVPFLPFSKRDLIVCSSFNKRMDCFHCVDMAEIGVYDRLIWSCVYITNVEGLLNF